MMAGGGKSTNRNFKLFCTAKYHTFFFQQSSTTWYKTSPQHHLLAIDH